MKDWKEKKARESRYWMNVLNRLHRQNDEFKARVEKDAWVAEQKKKNPTLFK